MTIKKKTLIVLVLISIILGAVVMFISTLFPYTALVSDPCSGTKYYDGASYTVSNSDCIDPKAFGYPLSFGDYVYNGMTGGLQNTYIHWSAVIVDHIIATLVIFTILLVLLLIVKKIVLILRIKL